jgi:uncharacterized protein YuzE
MSEYDDKRVKVDSIENASNDNVPATGDVDDKIIFDLEHHGEEIGMTFRTIIAAAASTA